MATSLCRGVLRPTGSVVRLRSSLSASISLSGRSAAAATTRTTHSGSISRQAGPAICATVGGGPDECCAHQVVRAEQQQQQRRSLASFKATLPRRQEFVIDLPALGDSITEGTVVQWCKAVGDDVAEGEVIAVVETDKVSVDVRSSHVGVVVKLFAAVDDVVQVGAALCTIDGDEAAVVKAKLEAAETEEAANAPPPEIKKPNLEDAVVGAFMAGAAFVPPQKKKHEPLIKFLGKRALLWEQKESEKAAPAEPTRHRHTPGVLDFSQIVGGASFGRPVMTDDEMEAINSGGAECAPQLRYIDGSRWA